VKESHSPVSLWTQAWIRKASTWTCPGNHFFCIWYSAECRVSWLVEGLWSWLSWQNWGHICVILLSTSLMHLSQLLGVTCGHWHLAVSCPCIVRNLGTPLIQSTWTGWMFAVTCDDKARCWQPIRQPWDYPGQHGEGWSLHWVGERKWLESWALVFHWQPNRHKYGCKQFSTAQLNFLHFGAWSRTCNNSWAILRTRCWQEKLSSCFQESILHDTPCRIYFFHWSTSTMYMLMLPNLVEGFTHLMTDGWDIPGVKAGSRLWASWAIQLCVQILYNPLYGLSVWL